MLTLVRVSTLDAWAELLTDLTVQPPLCDLQAGDCGQHVTVVCLFFVTFIFLVCSIVATTQWWCVTYWTFTALPLRLFSLEALEVAILWLTVHLWPCYPVRGVPTLAGLKMQSSKLWLRCTAKARQ